MKSHINIPENNLNAKAETLDLRCAVGDGLSAAKLKAEQNFESYLQMLKGFAKRYCVMVAAKGTPCGSAFTDGISKAFMNVGFKTDLRGKDFCGYAALIDGGRVVFEMLEADVSKLINIAVDLDMGQEVKLFSSGERSFEINKGLISVSGREYSPNSRGLNLVVYDKVTDTVIDAVCFDPSNSNSVFRAENYSEKFRKYEEKHPGVRILGFNTMRFPFKNPTAAEKKILEENLTYHKLKDDLQGHKYVYEDYFTDREAEEVLTIPPSYRDVYGAVRFVDKQSKHVNIVNGHRVTPYQPKADGGSVNIYMCGICLTFGLGAADDQTAPCVLQRLFNEKLPNCHVTVHNYGSFLENVDETEEVLRLMETLPVKAGDIILWNGADHVLNRAGVEIIDIYGCAEQPHEKSLFFDSFHYNPLGQRLVAEKLFEELTKRGAVNKSPASAETAQKAYGFDSELSSELEQYKNILKEYYREMFSPVIGAAVMNCNPFTLGHRYLVEQALSQCDFLIIFVVEEDKSVFPFEDRLRLVDEGVSDLANVTVIPSGKFVISSLTFSDYFNKSELQDRTVDTSLDVTVFAREIAPCLHITKRFAGSEPFDSVTRRYNEAMSRILPEYGIEFKEIPRAEINGQAVSASKVRQMILDGNLAGVRQYVPETTFDYLLKLFSDQSSTNS
ncbi:MAG: adenylyltransferase/cytidyltransferase family protein [Firmicutes bacterium]|nr:adenylyltransferase/cytidyltransferase family protein [[Eubacterium] siraeum]MCM1488813.1 adenylyltransferase/cytidyltransferase family protein [Bacillota bacterium]